MPDSLSRREAGSHKGHQDSPSISVVDSTGMQDTKMGSDIRCIRAAVLT